MMLAISEVDAEVICLSATESNESDLLGKSLVYQKRTVMLLRTLAESKTLFLLQILFLCLHHCLLFLLCILVVQSCTRFLFVLDLFFV
eukprot:m.15840 g.15840  ORF g.15840 m.15840 type:complete len:88 (-) comp3463_c0_seq1:319-582(-)